MLVINHTLLIESFLMMCQESSSFPPSNRKREHKSARNPFHHYHSNSHSSTTQRVCRPAAAPPSQPGHAITTSFIAMLQQPSDESLLTVHPQTVPDPYVLGTWKCKRYQCVLFKITNCEQPLPYFRKHSFMKGSFIETIHWWDVRIRIFRNFSFMKESLVETIQ